MWMLSPLPIVGAPMAGTSTPALTAAISAAGGFGMHPAAYLTVEQLAEQLAQVRHATDRPFGVNFFVPTTVDEARDAAAVAAYAEALRPVAQSLGAEVPAPEWSDDDAYDAKIGLVAEQRVPLVSFTFGCPSGAVVEQLHSAGCLVSITVTDADEAVAATSAGADQLTLQGADAGGHRSTHDVTATPNTRGWADLLPRVREVADLPVVVAGGIMAAREVQAALQGGAVAAQCGTAFLLCDETGLNPTYRAGFTAPESTETVVTRTFSGRPARGVRNEFTDRFEHVVPPVFPVVNQLTKPIRAAANRVGNPQLSNQWAGTGWRQARPGPAADVVAALAADVR